MTEEKNKLEAILSTVLVLVMLGFAVCMATLTIMCMIKYINS